MSSTDADRERTRIERLADVAMMIELFGEWNEGSTDRRLRYQSRDLWASDLRAAISALSPAPSEGEWKPEGVTDASAQLFRKHLRDRLEQFGELRALDVRGYAEVLDAKGQIVASTKHPSLILALNSLRAIANDDRFWTAANPPPPEGELDPVQVAEPASFAEGNAGRIGGAHPQTGALPAKRENSRLSKLRELMGKVEWHLGAREIELRDRRAPSREIVEVLDVLTKVREVPALLDRLVAQSTQGEIRGDEVALATLSEWTPELEAARMALCQTTGDEEEAALTLLGDIIARAKVSLASQSPSPPSLPPGLLAQVKEALEPFARYCDLNDLDERNCVEDAIEVPIRDLLRAAQVLRSCESADAAGDKD